MKYFGQGSVSSVISVILSIAWPLVLVTALAGSAFFGIILFSEKANTFISDQLKKDPDTTPKEIKEWEDFRNAPLPLKLLLFPFGAAVAILMLMIIKKSKQLFDNFKKEMIFTKANVELLTNTNKLILAFSIITFNISGIFTCILLFMLAEIFKNGAKLQEEHDLTV